MRVTPTGVLLVAAALVANSLHADVLPAPAVSTSPRVGNLFAASVATGFFAGSVGFSAHIGGTLGMNLGPFVMVDLTAGLPHALAGVKLLFGRGEMSGYLAGRAGVLVWSPHNPLLLASLGLDISRPEGTYAFIEAGPVIHRTSVDSFSGTPGQWRFVVVQVAYGIGKRF
jgi:hypothetical protein